MAFSKLSGQTLSSLIGSSQLDQSQISKIEEAGFQVTPVSSDSSVLSNTSPAVKEIMPGKTVPGFVDTVGNFFVVDSNNTVNNVSSAPTIPIKPVMEGNGMTGGPLFNPTDLLPPAKPVNPILPPPPPNLGSGRIFTSFQAGDIVPNQQETVTRALWSNNTGNLITFFTSSAQTANQKRYYYEVYNSGSGCGTEAQFSVVWGHKQGSGSADEGGQINDTPSRAVYGQLRMLCLDSGQERFIINGSATDNVYGILVNRARMRESLDEGNIEINLQRLSGSFWLAGGGQQNAWTGSNVKTLPTNNVIRLVDDSKISSANITEVGEVYNIVSGTIEDGIYNATSPHYYGLMYKRLGIIILDGRAMDISCSFLTVTGSEVPGDNAWKLYTSISGAAKYTDLSGDVLGFQGRSSEKVKSSHYFVRVKNGEYNFSNNPSFITGSEGDLSEPTMINDPKVYITSVGLYNDAKELLAIAKTSKPIQKSFTKEALIKVRLDF
jgi:hypothetical protein